VLVQPHTLLHVRCCGFEIFKCPEVVPLGNLKYFDSKFGN
jgi:hypothetical protein